MDLRNGPPEAGKFESETENMTPIPLGAAVPETDPLTFGLLGLKNSISGRVATYVVPGGLLSTTVASPSAPVVTFWAMAEVRIVAKTTELIVIACMMKMYCVWGC